MFYFKTSRLTVCAMLCVLGSQPSTAAATLMEGEFSGTLSDVVDNLGIFGAANTGGIVQGSFSYDTDLLPTNSCSGPWGCYLVFDRYPSVPPAIANITFNIGSGLTFSGNHYGSQVRIGDYITTQLEMGEPAGHNWDEFGVSVAYQDQTTLRFATITTITTNQVFNSADPTQTFSLGSEGLVHADAPVFSSCCAYFSQGSIYVGQGGSQSHLSFDITALSLRQVTAVPEPKTYLQMIAGLGLIGFAAQRRRRREMAA